MSSDFEAFRRERNLRRRQNKLTERPAGNHHREVWEQIEAQERSEMKDELLNAEVDEFFSEATRIAATIVQRLASNHEQAISDQLRREMEEFLRDSIRHATNMVLNIDWNRSSQGGEAIVEPSLKNLVGRELDEFRAEGTAQLSNKHFGQDPFGTGLGAEVSESGGPTAPSSLEDAKKAAMRDSQRIKLNEQERQEQAAPETGSAGAMPHVDYVEYEEAEDDDAGAVSNRKIRLSEDELNVDFQAGMSSEAGFSADQFDARIGETSAISRGYDEEPAAEGYAGDEGYAGYQDDEDDMPLAATYGQLADEDEEFEGDDAEEAPRGPDLAGVEMTQDEMEELQRPPGASAGAGAQGEDPRGSGRVPAAVGAGGDGQQPLSEDRIKLALRLLVQQGVMTPEQARSAFRAKTQQ